MPDKPKHGGRRPGSGRKRGVAVAPNPATAQIAVRLPPDVRDAYKALCASEGVTPSDDLRAYVERRLLEAVRS